MKKQDSLFFSFTNPAMRAKIVILFVLLFAISFSCKKKEDTVPYVEVNFDISLTDPSFVDLNAVGGWVYVTGGVRGIIIFRKSQNEFVSYERNCPYKSSENCSRVSVDSSNVKASDPCCGTIFSVLDGSVISGPSSRPLKQYNTLLNGNILNIQN